MNSADLFWSERRLLSFDGTPLYYRVLDPPGAHKATLMIVHGMAEHGGRYRPLAEFLSLQGFRCCLPDLRGFGLSGGKRGCVDGFEDYYRDLHAILVAVRPTSEQPLFVLGHSYGGLITSSWVASSPEIRCKGLVLSSPEFGLHMPIPSWLHWLATGLSYVVPDLTQNNRVDTQRLTHDLSVYRAYRNDKAIHHRISMKMYRVMMEQIRCSNRTAGQIRCSTLLLQAGDDQVVSREATQAFYDKLNSEDKRLEIFEGLYHEILHETRRLEIFGIIGDWLRRRIT